MRHHWIVAATAVAFSSSVALAQGVVVEGTVGAAPVVELPAEARSYVIEERVPSVRVEEEIAVGAPLPPTVELHTIPRFDRYRFAIVNERRVLVDPGTRRVVRIVE